MTYLPLGTNSQNASFKNEDLPLLTKNQVIQVFRGRQELHSVVLDS